MDALTGFVQREGNAPSLIPKLTCQLLLFAGLSAAFPRPSRLNCFASARACSIPSSRTCSKLITCWFPSVCESNCISCLKMSKNDWLPVKGRWACESLYTTD